MQNLHTCLLMTAATDAGLTPGEHQYTNQFLRGNAEMAG